MFILWFCILWDLLRGHQVNGLKLDWQHSARRERCAIKKCTCGRMAAAVPDGKICSVTSIPQILCLRALSLHNLHFMSHRKYALVLQNPTKNKPSSNKRSGDCRRCFNAENCCPSGGLCADDEQVISHSKSWLFSPFLSIFHHTPLFAPPSRWLQNELNPCCGLTTCL